MMSPHEGALTHRRTKKPPNWGALTHRRTKKPPNWGSLTHRRTKKPPNRGALTHRRTKKPPNWGAFNTSTHKKAPQLGGFNTSSSRISCVYRRPTIALNRRARRSAQSRRGIRCGYRSALACLLPSFGVVALPLYCLGCF